jgi:signal transduction histidine kinase
VATAPSASPTERSPAARHRDVTLWWTGFVILVSLSVAYLVLPTARVTLRDVFIYPAVELGAAVCIVIGVWRFRPSVPQAWLFIAAGIFMWFVGDLLWGIYEITGRDPYPSVADLFYIAGYPLIAVGLGYAARLRSGNVGAETGTFIDGLLVAVLALLLAWVFLIDPILDDSTLTAGQKLVSSAYPLGDVLLVAVAARFVMGTSWHVPALWLLVAGLALTLAGDVLYASSVLTLQHSDRIWSAALLFGLVCFGLAGLSRSMRVLTEERTEGDTAPDSVRNSLLLLACVIPPAVLVVQSLRDKPLYVAATVTAMVSVSVLVVFRFMYVTRRIRRAVAREALLRGYAAELLRLHDEQQLRAAAIRTANDLVGGGAADLLAPEHEPGPAHTFSAPIEVRGERLWELVVDGDPVDVRRAEYALTTIAAQLALAVERERLLQSERTAAEALAEQNARLLELDRMKDQFVGSVSHELRTPLTSMVGYLELLLDEDDVGDLDEEERKHFLEIVNRSCLRLNRLVDDILFVARVDAGRLSLEREAVDFGALAAASVETARAAARAKKVDIRFSKDDGMPELDADPLRLTQMLDNLISNAVKFTPESGTVTVTLASNGEGVHFEIADTGVGIPADEVEKLFDRFFRASTSGVVRGTGLGLSIVKSIVDVHGGTIRVESTEGVGTTFVVDLPVHALPETPPATEASTTEVTT